MKIEKSRYIFTGKCGDRKKKKKIKRESEKKKSKKNIA
jgi:hypothetical protein